MNYTLFIDESGDFLTQRGEWVIGGTLFEGNLEEVEKKFTAISFPRNFEPVHIRQFHLTEFRTTYGSEVAVQKASVFFDAISKTNLKYYFLTVINEKKIGLSQRERTYRAMLRDLLALIDNSVPTVEQIDHLDLIVASRTINGELQTSLTDLTTDILNYLPKDFEYDLSSQNLVGLIRQGKVTSVIKQANCDWGLVCSDFISNLTYHRNGEYESLLLRKLEIGNRLFSFNGLGDLARRRARIAEANNDPVLAVIRWIEIASNQNNKEKSSEAEIEIIKLLTRLINSQGSSCGLYSSLALIERVWRLSENDYEFRNNQLRILEKCFLELNDSHYAQLTKIIFKLRNLILINLNHYGNVEDAFDLLNIQSKAVPELIYDPDNFSLVADFYRIRIETFINNLQIEKAYEVAQTYERFSSNIESVWQLLDNEDNDLSKFYSSQFWIRRESSLLRIYAMTERVDDDFNFRIKKLLPCLKNSSDISRLRFSETVKNLVIGKCDTAYEKLVSEEISFKNSQAYDLCLLLKVMNSNMLELNSSYVNLLEDLKDRLTSDHSLEVKKHPNELIFAEAALLFYLHHDDKSAKKYISKALTLFNLDKSSPIANMIFNLLSYYYSFIFEKQQNKYEFYFNNLISSLKDISDNRERLISIRRFYIRF